MAEIKHEEATVAPTLGVDTPTSDDPRVSIPVENYLPDDVPTFYSDGMVVLHTANEFILSFLQTVFPLAASKDELEKVVALKRKCIAQMIISPAQAEAIIKALQENMNKYVNAYRKPENTQ